MGWFLCVIAILCLWRLKISKFNEDYISKDATNSIKGIFVILILLSHSNGAFEAENPTQIMSQADKIYNAIQNHLGQLVVAMYLFYSGYGILESYKKKTDYLNGFLRHRFFKTLLHFCLAVSLYLIIQLAFEHTSDFTIKQYSLCWIGWESIGNSNWYIFDILVLYLGLYAVLKCKEKFNWGYSTAIIAAFAFTAVFWAFLHVAKGGAYYWYNTLLCFPAGMLYSLIKDKVENTIRSNSVFYYLLFFVCFFFLIALRRSFSVKSAVFAYMVALMGIKIKIDNPILRFLGEYTFPMYILQRLPMIAMTYTGITYKVNNITFTLIVFCSTLILSIIFNWVTERLDKLVKI